MPSPRDHRVTTVRQQRSILKELNGTKPELWWPAIGNWRIAPDLWGFLQLKITKPHEISPLLIMIVRKSLQIRLLPGAHLHQAREQQFSICANDERDVDISQSTGLPQLHVLRTWNTLGRGILASDAY
jgi:hypothetical protein